MAMALEMENDGDGTTNTSPPPFGRALGNKGPILDFHLPSWLLETEKTKCGEGNGSSVPNRGNRS